jgi:DNA-directed RNA polymerase subunit beta'
MLLGLKENVIIGKLIPAGTGIEAYNNVEVVKNEILPEHSNVTSNVSGAAI